MMGGALLPTNQKGREMNIETGDYRMGDLLGVSTRPWPDWLAFGEGKCRKTSERYRYPERFGEGADFQVWPVAIDFVERIMQRDFWEVEVQSFKAQALRPPKLLAVSSRKGQRQRLLYGHDLKNRAEIEESIRRDTRPKLYWKQAKTSNPNPQSFQPGSEEYVKLRTFQVNLIEKYTEELDKNTQWAFHDQIKQLCDSDHIAVRCHCCLLLSTLDAAGTDHYRKVLRERGKQDFGVLAHPQAAVQRDPRLWDKTLALLRQVADMEKTEAKQRMAHGGEGDEDQQSKRLREGDEDEHMGGTGKRPRP